MLRVPPAWRSITVSRKRSKVFCPARVLGGGGSIDQEDLGHQGASGRTPGSAPKLREKRRSSCTGQIASQITGPSRFSKISFRAWRALGLKSPSISKALISFKARDTFLTVACLSSIRGALLAGSVGCTTPGVSTPSSFDQAKNSSTQTSNPIEIVRPGPFMEAVFPSQIPKSENLHNQ
jgi:hypothetical protein